MPERDLIELVLGLAGRQAPSWLLVNAGDDAAVIELPGGGEAVLTVDSVIAGVHVEPDAAPGVIGRKAVARALSDLAAMAARPLCTLAAVCVPTGADDEACRELVQALWDSADELGARLVGGDVASGAGPLSVTVTAVGTPGPGGIVRRAGAQVGDAVCVTGRLGGSLLGRHLGFKPRLAEALALAERFAVHAMIDISDGLSTDALHLAEASGRALQLWADVLPVSDAARELAERTGHEPLWHALNDGEDYELLFCVPRGAADGLTRAGIADVPVTRIGEVTGDGASQIVMADGRHAPLKPEGWEHLRA